MKYYSAINKNEILPFASTQMKLEGIILSEISQRKINIIWSHLYAESENKKQKTKKKKNPTHSHKHQQQKFELIHTENRLVISRGHEWGGNWGMGEES